MHVIVEFSGEADFHLCSNKPPPQRGLIAVPFLDTVDHLFKSAWKHPDRPCPQIKHIFYVAHSGPDALAHLARFSNYSNKVGNTQLLFHGTQHACTIGDTPASTSLCERANCNLCLILRGSYDMEKTKNDRMFGSGIYSTSVSSKADVYASFGHTTGSKSVILNHVVLGRTKLLFDEAHHLQHAPHIFNSVTGATLKEGGRVKYHEAVVYREDGICASAVIFYA